MNAIILGLGIVLGAGFLIALALISSVYPEDYTNYPPEHDVRRKPMR